MDAGLGVDQNAPNDPNMISGVKTGKIVSSVNIFKIAIIFSVVLIAGYGLFIDKNAFLISCLMIQWLFITFLIVMAILGIKDETKEKKTLSYIYLLVALFSVILGIISSIEILKYW